MRDRQSSLSSLPPRAAPWTVPLRVARNVARLWMDEFRQKSSHVPGTAIGVDGGSTTLSCKRGRDRGIGPVSATRTRDRSERGLAGGFTWVRGMLDLVGLNTPEWEMGAEVGRCTEHDAAQGPITWGESDGELKPEKSERVVIPGLVEVGAWGRPPSARLQPILPSAANGRKNPTSRHSPKSIPRRAHDPITLLHCRCRHGRLK